MMNKDYIDEMANDQSALTRTPHWQLMPPRASFLTMDATGWSGDAWLTCSDFAAAAGLRVTVMLEPKPSVAEEFKTLDGQVVRGADAR